MKAIRDLSVHLRVRPPFPTRTIQKIEIYRPGLDVCPEKFLFDVIHHIHTQEARQAQQTPERKSMKLIDSDINSREPGRGKPTLLTSELSQFNTFKKLLKVGDKRASLHQMLQVTNFAKIE